MNHNYYEQICPFCKMKFKENDEIVICSICKVPHHKDCWIENKGCTISECTGRTKNADIVGYSDDMYNTVTIESCCCPSCGAENPTSANFCGSCGANLFKIDIDLNPLQNSINSIDANKVQNENEQIVENAETIINHCEPVNQEEMYNDYELVNKFVFSNKEYYAERFKYLYFNNTTVSWNWSAFFSGFSWFVYRRMYKEAAYLFVITCIITLMVFTGMAHAFIGVLGIAFALTSAVSMGFFANHFYFEFINKEILFIKDAPKEVQENYCSTYGGVNDYGAAASIFFWFFISFIEFIIMYNYQFELLIR